MLEINGVGISASIKDILKQVRFELNGQKLKHIISKVDELQVTCPYHKDGKENRPSCFIYIGDKATLPYGSFHCFTCGEKGSISKFINLCFNGDKDFGDKWLVDRFGNTLLEKTLFLPEIELTKSNTYLDPGILDQYKYIHPYLIKRHIKEEVIKKFTVGFDKDCNCVVFPVWDEHDNLVMLTKRSIENKFFYIDKDIEKPVYLLNFMLKENVKELYITESQINALTLQGYGLPAVALIGTGTKKQYKILSRCGIHHFILCLDGDDAGRKGILRFIEALELNNIIEVILFPEGKDVNDLSEHTFKNLRKIDSFTFKSLYK